VFDAARKILLDVSSRKDECPYYVGLCFILESHLS